MGTNHLACGSGGRACVSCLANQVCLIGLCTDIGGTGGGAGGTGGGTGGGSPGSDCAGTLTKCAASCVDTAVSIEHCGRCGKTCKPGEVCYSGSCRPLPEDCRLASGCPTGFYCEPTDRQCKPGCLLNAHCPAGATCNVETRQCSCPSGQHPCGQVCVPDSSPASCGATCTPCPTPPNATAQCEQGLCTFSCNPGFHRCGEQCLPNDSAESCGNNCSPCPAPPNGTAACLNGVCGVGTCNAGFHLCSGQCVSNASPQSCGTSCTPCPGAPNATPTCTGGVCGISCNAGYHLCGTQCVSNSSPQTCGTSCTPCTAPANATATCDGQRCGFVCNPGWYRCGAACCAWTVEVVDPTPNNGEWSSIAIDDAGTVHVSYYQATHGDLRYARKEDGGWSLVTVDSLDVRGEASSIALGPDGVPHIAYFDRTAENVRYATLRPDGGWFVQAVALSGQASRGVTSLSTIAVSSSGLPRIAFRGYQSFTGPCYAERTPGGTWSALCFNAGSVGNVHRVGLALDQSDQPHLVFCDDLTTYDVKHLMRLGDGGWQANTVALGIGPIGCDVAVNPAGVPHAVYGDTRFGGVRGLYFATWGGVFWTTEAVDVPQDVGGYASLAFDSAGRPHIAYYDYANGDLKYARRNGGVWELSRVDSTGSVGTFTDIAVDSSGRPHITYYDSSQGVLKYARW